MATKTVKKIRITQVAKDLGIPTKDIIEKCISEGIEGVTTPQASIPIGLSLKRQHWIPWDMFGDSLVLLQDRSPHGQSSRSWILEKFLRIVQLQLDCVELPLSY